MKKRKLPTDYVNWLKENHPDACMSCGKPKQKNLNGELVCPRCANGTK